MLTVARIRDEKATRESAQERTCAGCRASGDREDLLRLAFVAELESPLVPDIAHKLGGRGLWVHAKRSCVRTAVRGGFARALRREVNADVATVCASLGVQLTRAIEGLLMAAARRRAVALGTEAVAEALRGGAASLLLVAKDAAGRREDLVEKAKDKGLSWVELGDKAWLGRLCGRETLGVLALLDAQIAREIATKARWLAGLSEDG